MSDAPRLSPRQEQLLARELERRRAAGPSTIPRRPDGEEPPLSPAQRRLWFLDQISPGRSTYNATLTMRIAGPLDVEALHTALDLIVTRHEALRTVGVDDGTGQPAGRLLHTGVRWRYRDIDEADLSDALAADAREPFDLAADVMLRAALYRVDPAVHVLILIMHHIATDGWSRTVLFDELAEAYNAAVERRPPRLAPLEVQYGDYARWQLHNSATGSARRSDEFWVEALRGADFVLELPVDFPRPATPDHVGTRVAMDGSPGSGDTLRALARAERCTFFMATLAVTGVLLSALSGQDDIVLGSPVANRQRPELERLIGFFVNTVILRVRLDGAPTFRELLGRCRTAALGSLAHQDTALDRVVELVNPRRAPGRNPLFQVNFRMQGIAPPPPRLRGLEVTRMVTDTGASRFDLAFGLVDQPDALRGYVEYSASLFRPSTAEALQATFVKVADWAVAEPDTPLPAWRQRIQDAFAEDRRAGENAAAPRTRSIRSRR